MSELDNIYFDIHYANPPHGKFFAINVQNDLVYQGFKHELKNLLFELIGHDEPETPDDAFDTTKSARIAKNELRAEIWARVEAL